MYNKLEQLVLKGDQRSKSDKVLSLYYDDFGKIQLSTFMCNYKI